MKRLSILLAALLLAASFHAQTPAKSLATTGAPVNVSNAAPPSGSGRACVTTNATHCTWQLLSGIGLLTVPVPVADGGTGIDGTDLLAFASTTGDSATTTFTLSATDTNAHTSAVSWGIELPGDGVSAGDAVLRTGSAVERMRVQGGAGNAVFTSGDGVTHQTSLATSGQSAFFLSGTDSDGNAVSGVFSTLDTNVAKVVAVASAATPSGGALYIDNTPSALFDGAGNGYSVPLAAFEISSGSLPGVFAHSLSGPSALFQTSATDGSNANATVVVKGNTGQTTNLSEWAGTDGSTVVGSMSIGGVFDATGFSVASVPGDSGTDTIGNVFVNGICTSVATT
jgi:hypothetical protein